VYDSGDRTFSVSRERFFLVGDGAGDPYAPAPIWIATMEGTPLPSPTYNHVAFKIEQIDYERCVAAIQSLGIEVREGRARIEGGGVLDILSRLRQPPVRTAYRDAQRTSGPLRP
jgi:fosfomycin resistance protein FosX